MHAVAQALSAATFVQFGRGKGTLQQLSFPYSTWDEETDADGDESVAHVLAAFAPMAHHMKQ